MMMGKDPFVDGRKVIKKIEEANEQAFFVGGCVRDLLLNRSIKDIDIATSASPKCIQTLFKKVIPVGIEHGTVIVRFNHQSYEVTTFRVDGKYSDQRHPDHVKFIHKIDKDLERRDFTINSLAMDREGKIIDLFGGKKDLQLKIIRTVGNGHERFLEDALRMVRAIRFSSQLGFTIEKETLTNIIDLRESIQSIAIERMTNEFTKLFAGKYVNKGIYYLQKSKIYQYLPIMSQHPYIIDDFPILKYPFRSFGEVLALFNYLDPNIPISKWINGWKCSNQTKREMIALSKALHYYSQNGLDRWLVYDLPAKYYKGFLRLINNIWTNNWIDISLIKKIEKETPIRSTHDLALKGDDIIEMFPHRKKGPWIRNTINKIEKAIVFGKLRNRKTDLKEWIKCSPPKID